MAIMRTVIPFFLCVLSLLLGGCTLTRQPVATLSPLPTVQFLAPAPDVSIAAGDELTITLVASDPHGTGVARVDLLIDDLPHQSATPVSSAAVPVFTVEMNWIATTPGLHALTAVPYRLDGTRGQPTAIRVLVLPPGTVPTPLPQVG